MVSSFSRKADDGVTYKSLAWQPCRKPPTSARTCEGENARSNDCASNVPPERRLRNDWWRASTVRIEPAAVRSDGFETRWACVWATIR